MTDVVCLKNDHYDIYIGRKSGHQHFGNPWSHLAATEHDTIKVASADIAVNNFEAWLKGTDFQDIKPKQRKWILDNLHRLKGQILGCYCSQKSIDRYECHGRVLAELVDPSPQLTKEQAEYLLSQFDLKGWNNDPD